MFTWWMLKALIWDNALWAVQRDTVLQLNWKPVINPKWRLEVFLSLCCHLEKAPDAGDVVVTLRLFVLPGRYTESNTPWMLLMREGRSGVELLKKQSVIFGNVLIFPQSLSHSRGSVSVWSLCAQPKGPGWWCSAHWLLAGGAAKIYPL